MLITETHAVALPPGCWMPDTGRETVRMDRSLWGAKDADLFNHSLIDCGMSPSDATGGFGLNSEDNVTRDKCRCRVGFVGLRLGLVGRLTGFWS